MAEGIRQPNRLAHEKSPYLLQHAYNPVDWYPWHPEAFAKAKSEDKPVFLSVGYATCHWCHVMERESFEDETVAGILNRDYVPVKVDREERPDVDHIYMTVCQALTGQGGWPLTVIMTPDRHPFFAGTYFPRDQKYGRPGLIDILNRVATLWEKDRKSLSGTGQQVTDAIKSHFSTPRSGEVPYDVTRRARNALEAQFDEQYGGFGQSPKFPTPHTLSFLTRHYWLEGDQRSLEMVERTLEGMYRGGMYDHVGFGFARYSTDREWLVPHFEKMLYDNALLALAYLDAYQVTGRDLYSRVADEIFTYIERDMTDPSGGFYSAEDADSEGVEGKFYVFTPEELRRVLGPTEADLYCRVFGITPGGNFEGKSIPNLLGGLPQEFARDKGMPDKEIRELVSTARQKVLAYRSERQRPLLDDKILTSWNALMIAALARGGRVLGQSSLVERALRASSFIQDNLYRRDGRLLARFREGEAAIPGYLDDYAFLAYSHIELYWSTLDPDHLERGLEITRDMLDLFWDQDGDGLFLTGSDSEEHIARPREIRDGALPAGASVAAFNLAVLARLTGDESLDDYGGRIMFASGEQVRADPSSHAFLLMALQFQSQPGAEIVIAGDPGDRQTRAMIEAVQGRFLPTSILIFVPDDSTRSRVTGILPHIKDMKSHNGRAVAYVCRDFACREPVSERDELVSMLPGKQDTGERIRR